MEADRASARQQLLEEGFTPQLLAGLAHADPHVRWQIVDILGTLADPRALDALGGRARRDSDPHVRWRSLWALSRVASPDRIVAAVAAGLGSDDPDEVWGTAVALSFFDSTMALPRLHESVTHLDPFRRWEAINSLGRVHDATTPDVLRSVLHSPSARDRHEVVLTLGQIGGPKGNALLFEALSDEEASVRWRAAMALSRSGTGDELETLRQVAETDADAQVREHAAKAISRIEQRHSDSRRAQQQF
ncbi:MAG TPA: HEAT repeat domain-containing protein [Thermoanaerobaculia bacterium]|nr:HEAT repeat domain-containing protein [Thermoanaerobaculia bacterium]